MGKKILKFIYRKFYKKIFHDTLYELRRELDDCKSILDLGCGSSSSIKYLQKNFYSVGVDIFKPSIEKSKREGIHNEYILMDVLDIDKIFQPNSFDCVLALELIEHLEKKDGIRLIEMMEKIAKKKVIIITPNGFLPQEEYDGNIWQIHKSGWSAGEMRKRGYRVIGLNGWKALRGGRASLRFSPEIFWLIISDVTQLFVRYKPERAFHNLCVKIIKIV